MIGSLCGSVAAKQPPLLLLEVAGVGYELEAPMSTFFKLPAVGESVRLHTHLAVRDDAIQLFAFATTAERRLFRELLKVSGVGARMALTVLSGISVDAFVATVQEGDAARLTGLPGVGKKIAARLVLEMRDRLDAGSPAMPGGATFAPVDGVAQDAVTEAHRALTALGYKPAEARRLLTGLPTEGTPSEELIRQALKRAMR
ncbi:MAG: Holliday junction branch migration protein RuvA [Salinisphaera sp.]|nr:Holliday junction branch migration protein RuvA [Salinisphaera sp.]